MRKRHAREARPRDGIHYRDLQKLADNVNGNADMLTVDGIDLEALVNTPGEQGAVGMRKAKRRDFGRLDNNEVETPPNIIEMITAEFGSFFDPCPYMGKNKKPLFDALSEEELTWGEFNYVNPPYDFIDPWVARAHNEMVKYGNSTLVFVPARTGSAYWRDNVWGKCTELRFLTGKVLFVGYEHPSPHQLVCIIYLSKRELLNHHTNSLWPLGKLLKEDAALRSQYPELWTIVAKAQDVVGNFTGRDRVWQWMKELYTADDLMEQIASQSLGKMTYELILPLYARMLRFMLRRALFIQHAHESKRAFALPELLRRMASMLAGNRAFMNKFECMPLPLDRPSAVGFVVSFYEAFMENASIHYENSQRSHKTRNSFDGEYQMWCIEFPS